jgi:hypothetical protein
MSFLVISKRNRLFEVAGIQAIARQTFAAFLGVFDGHRRSFDIISSWDIPETRPVSSLRSRSSASAAIDASSIDALVILGIDWTLGFCH